MSSQQIRKANSSDKVVKELQKLHKKQKKERIRFGRRLITINESKRRESLSRKEFDKVIKELNNFIFI